MLHKRAKKPFLGHLQWPNICFFFRSRTLKCRLETALNKKWIRFERPPVVLPCNLSGQVDQPVGIGGDRGRRGAPLKWTFCHVRWHVWSHWHETGLWANMKRASQRWVTEKYAERNSLISSWSPKEKKNPAAVFPAVEGWGCKRAASGWLLMEVNECKGGCCSCCLLLHVRNDKKWIKGSLSAEWNQAQPQRLMWFPASERVRPNHPKWVLGNFISDHRKFAGNPNRSWGSTALLRPKDISYFQNSWHVTNDKYSSILIFDILYATTHPALPLNAYFVVCLLLYPFNASDRCKRGPGLSNFSSCKFFSNCFYLRWICLIEKCTMNKSEPRRRLKQSR